MGDSFPLVQQMSGLRTLGHFFSCACKCSYNFVGRLVCSRVSGTIVALIPLLLINKEVG